MRGRGTDVFSQTCPSEKSAVSQVLGHPCPTPEEVVVSR